MTNSSKLWLQGLDERMFTLLKPNPKAVFEFLRRAAKQDFSYAETGATRGTLPRGYNHDHNRITLGEGGEIFRRAVGALRSWHMLELGWVHLFERNTPITVGANVALAIRHFGFWSLNASRILYVLEEDRRFGFAYGTLRDHAEQGEERFCIEWDLETNFVYYDILAFSRPRHWIVKLGKPLARMLQKRFVRDSKSTIQRAVNGV